MDPVTLAFIAAFGPALVEVLKKLAEKGLVEPALEPMTKQLGKRVKGNYDQKRDAAALSKALESALKKLPDISKGLTMSGYWLGTMAARIKEDAALAKRVAAATVELVRDDPSRLPPDLVDDLRLESERSSLAHFLFTLRGELIKLDSFKDGIGYANELAQLNRLDGLYELIAALAGNAYTGKALWVRNAPPDYAKLEEPYLRYVVNEFNHLSLLGRSKDETVATHVDDRMRLEQVYIQINTKEARRKFSAEDDGSPRRMREEDAALSALRALTESRHLVLLGYPGAGKSTFARHLCLCLAGARLGTASWQQRLALSENESWSLPLYFPIFVSLRDFAADEVCLPPKPDQRGLAEHLLNFIKQSLIAKVSPELANYVQALLDEGKALVIFDGLDEVTHPQRKERANMPQADDERRNQVAQAIENFTQHRFPYARAIVTCRVKQYKKESGEFYPWRVPYLPVFELAEFNPPQIRRFVELWFAASRVKDADHKRETLLTALSDRPDLTDLAPKPILLTQMAIVHTDDELPDSRVELYRICAELLLWRWEKLRTIQAGKQGKSIDAFIRDDLEIGGITRETLEDAIYYAVFTDHANSEAEILESTLLATLRDALAARNIPRDRAALAAQRFIDQWLKEKNGLLRPAKGDTFDFPHRSFREYLAARVLASKGYAPDSKTRPPYWFKAGPHLALQDPTKWREVLRFAAAISRDKIGDLTDALNTLYPEGTLADASASTRLLLAGEILRDVGAGQFDEPQNSWAKPSADRIKDGLIHLMRDSGDAAYPNDKPHTPPTPADTLTPQTRLEAGLLLDSLRWTPSDLHNVIVIGDTKPPFAIAKYPVTNWQYERFLKSDDYASESIWKSIVGFDEKGKPLPKVGAEAWSWFNERGGKEYKPSYWDNARFGASHRLLPVVTVTWYEAAAYCAWLEKHWRDFDDTRVALEKVLDGKFKARLLREEEWVKAAGGEQDNRHAWDKSKGDARPYMNYDDAKLSGTSPVCMYPAGASPLGVMDMSGNVWEWQANLFSEKDRYPALRGGAWNSDGVNARVSDRLRDNPDDRNSDFGYRLGLFPVL